MSPAAAPPTPIIRHGSCTALFAFDVAMQVDLDAAERLLRMPGGATAAVEGAAAPERETLQPSVPPVGGHVRKAPSYFEYRPPPLRVTLNAQAIRVAGDGDRGRSFETQPTVELLIFDFGAVCINYRIGLDGAALGDLLELSEQLFDCPALAADARRRVEAVAAAVGGALSKPGFTSQVEDYIIFELREVAADIGSAAITPSDLVDGNGRLLAQVLRAERDALSDEEIADALSCRVSYGVRDAAIIDWNAAVLLDRDAEDVRSVLEFANVELLEMRFLDDRLDEILEEAYHTVGHARVGLRAFFPSGSTALRRMAKLQMDSALLFEGVNNALKLIGDQYLARVYRVTAQRFHLPERDEIIERKLSTLQSIYDKLSDHEAGRRASVLEWIIILLILFEVVMGLLSLH